MKIGVAHCNSSHTIETLEKEFKIISEAGFDSVDLQCFLIVKDNPIFSLNDNEFKSFCEQIRNKAANNSLIVNQLHSFWEYPPIKDYFKEGLDNQIIYYKKAIEGARLLNCNYVVIHPRFPFGLDKKTNDENEEEIFKINVDFLSKIEKIARNNNVVLCLENLPMDFKYCRVDGIIRIIDAINSDYLKMCLDIGHANVFNDDIYQDIIKINDRLKCLHVHDNNCGLDLHMYPYQGSVNWDDVMKALKEINYQGVFSFEVSPHINLSYNTRLEGLKYLQSIGKDLTNKIK